MKHSLWVSCLHPTFSGLRVDYVLGNLESKLMWIPPTFPGTTIPVEFLQSGSARLYVQLW
jgi:hypothetical protein